LITPLGDRLIAQLRWQTGQGHRRRLDGQRSIQAKGLLKGLPPLACSKSMAVAMAGQEPGHIQIEQLAHRTNLLLEVPPAVALGSHHHLQRRVPPKVIAAEQHATAFPQQHTQRASRMTGCGDQPKCITDGNCIVSLQEAFNLRCGIGIRLMDPALTGERPSPALVIAHIIANG